MLSEGTSPQDLTPLMQWRYPPGPKKNWKKKRQRQKVKLMFIPKLFKFQPF